MPFRTTLMIALLPLWAAFSQIPKDELKSKISGVRYFALAEQARIQGDVHLRINAGMVTVRSGHPLLAPTAVESAKSLTSLQSDTDLDVTYHFVLVDTAASVPKSKLVKRGNVFERAILRVFGFKTEKVVTEYHCEERPAPQNDFQVDRTTIEIWIYGRTHCLQTETVGVVARR